MGDAICVLFFDDADLQYQVIVEQEIALVPVKPVLREKQKAIPSMSF